jgi:prepilin-type N-terminal cleavage/methylation domain-containing protein
MQQQEQLAVGSWQLAEKNPRAHRQLPTDNCQLSPAFTLIELLVVIGIIVILAGVLLPAVNRAYKNSQRLAMLQQFSMLSAALENYKADFRDYPKNSFAQNDYYVNPPQPKDVYRPDPARADGTLAMALLGPGPAALTTNLNGTVGGQSSDTYLDMDGADGPGFKSRFTVWGTTIINSGGATLPAGSNAINVSNMIFNTPLGNLGTLPQTNYPPAMPPPFTAISIGGPGSPDSQVAVQSWTDHVITLAAPLQQSYTLPVSITLLAPAGRTWGPYLPADKFKPACVGFTNDYLSASAMANGLTAAASPAVPVLLDIWGNQILYFPAYNSYKNHVGTLKASSSPSVGQVIGITPNANAALVGPLIGIVATGAQNNTPLSNPGATGGGTYTGPAVFWDGGANCYLTTVTGLAPYSGSTASPSSLTAVPISTGQIEAILWRLGDNQEPVTASYGSGPNNAINPGETLAVKDPYFLISAGPNGTFEDLNADVTNSPSVPPATLMSKSDDIYSFEGSQ